MKNIFKILLLIPVVMLTSCEDLVDGINDDPNGITISDVDAQLFLTGAQLANSNGQVGHLNRISGMWSGQLVGFASVYGNAYGYNISTAETNSTWSRFYIGVVPNARHIRNNLPNDGLLQGVSKVLEAHAIGSAASLFGNVPYSEINTEGIDDPKFDDQVFVLNEVISLLNDATTDLATASSRNLGGDIYFGGDAGKWLAAANTLKARYYMLQRDYSNALTAAMSGISSSDGTMKHIPRGEAATTTDKNTYWAIINGSRAGDIGYRTSYLSQLLDPADPAYRGNAKTNETARSAYYTMDENVAGNNMGIINQFEPQQMVSFEENHLILAEASARTSGFAAGLARLNEFRAWLASGGRINANFSGMTSQYDAYVEADFMAGGMENADNIDPTRALLREIIEERYISGFGEFMPFDDARRLRKSDTDIQVPFAPNSGGQHAERFPYADDELNANENGPAEDPGIFTKTPVNE